MQSLELGKKVACDGSNRQESARRGYMLSNASPGPIPVVQTSGRDSRLPLIEDLPAFSVYETSTGSDRVRDLHQPERFQTTLDPKKDRAHQPEGTQGTAGWWRTALAVPSFTLPKKAQLVETGETIVLPVVTTRN
jgi:hypothetical protein